MSPPIRADVAGHHGPGDAYNVGRRNGGIHHGVQINRFAKGDGGKPAGELRERIRQPVGCDFRLRQRTQGERAGQRRCRRPNCACRSRDGQRQRQPERRGRIFIVDFIFIGFICLSVHCCACLMSNCFIGKFFYPAGCRTGQAAGFPTPMARGSPPDAQQIWPSTASACSSMMAWQRINSCSRFLVFSRTTASRSSMS